MVIRVCVGCGVEFKPNTLKQINCSKRCRVNRCKREARGVAHPLVKCRDCDETFFRKSTRHKYCCSYCKAKGVAKDLGTPYTILKTQNSRSKTPETFIRSILCKGKNRSKLIASDIVELYYKQGGNCALSGIPMTYILGKGRVPTNISLDRIKVGGEYTKDNVRLVCSIVNVMRYTQDDAQLIRICRAIVEKHDNNYNNCFTGNIAA